MSQTATRQRIIEASARLFMRQGLAGSGLKQISAESSAPFGSLYHFFPGGKGELAAETLRWSGAAYAELVAAVFDAAPDLLTGVRRCFQEAANTLESTDFADACPIATVALEVANSDDHLRQVTDQIFAGWLAGLAARLRAAGIGRAKSAELATVLLASLEGGFLLSRAAKDAAPMRAIGRSMEDLVRSALADR